MGCDGLPCAMYLIQKFLQAQIHAYLWFVIHAQIYDWWFDDSFAGVFEHGANQCFACSWHPTCSWSKFMSQVQVVLLDDKDTPLKIEINSWITLMPGTRGGHAKDALKHGGSSIRGSYKAKVLKFRIRCGRVSSVLVEHASMRRELDLDPTVPLTLPNACSCKCHISNLTLKGQCKPHRLGIILGESC